MDTVIVKYHSIPILKDSITVKSDYSLIATELDSLRFQNQQNIQELKEAITVSKNEDRLVSVISNDALASTLITIVVFILGLLFQQLFHWSKRSRDKRRIKKAYQIQIDSMRKYLPRIIEGYQAIVHNTNVDDGLYLSAPTVNMTTFDRLISSEIKEILATFKNATDVTGIIVQAGNIKDTLTTAISFHSVLRNKLDEDKALLSEIHKQFLGRVSDYLIEVKTNLPDNYTHHRGYSTINNLLLQYHLTVRKLGDLEQVMIQTVTPIKTFIVNSHLYMQSQIANSIVDLANQELAVFNKITVETQEFIGQYEQFVTDLNKSKDGIEGVYNNIDWESKSRWI